MEQDLTNCDLIITNGLNGNTEILRDFFKYSHYVQTEILSDFVLPLLYEYKSCHISIGYKN